MNGKGIFLIGAAFIAWLLIAQKKAIALLSYSVEKVGVSFDGITPLLRLDILIQNVSAETFTIQSFVGNLLVNGYQVGTISSFTSLTIPAASQVVYPVVVRMSLIGVVSDLVNVITKGSGTSQVIQVNGFVNASGIVAPINLNYKVG